MADVITQTQAQAEQIQQTSKELQHVTEVAQEETKRAAAKAQHVADQAVAQATANSKALQSVTSDSQAALAAAADAAQEARKAVYAAQQKAVADANTPPVLLKKAHAVAKTASKQVKPAEKAAAKPAEKAAAKPAEDVAQKMIHDVAKRVTQHIATDMAKKHVAYQKAEEEKRAAKTEKAERSKAVEKAKEVAEAKKAQEKMAAEAKKAAEAEKAEEAKKALLARKAKQAAEAKKAEEAAEAEEAKKAAEEKKAEEAAEEKKAQEAAEEKKAQEAKEAEEAKVAKKVAQSLYTKKHVRVDDDMVDAPDTKVDELSAARTAMRAARAAAHKLKTKEPMEEEQKEPLGLVYLWSSPLEPWGQMLRAPEKKPKMALLSRADSVERAPPAGTSPHQDVKLTADEVAEEKDSDLHISDEFAGLAQRDQEDLDFQKQEDKRNKYDPVAAVKTDMEPRLRDNVELHDIFAHLEEQDTQVDNELARLGDNANFGAVRTIEDESMRMLENAQTAPAEIQPKPLSWNDSDPEGQIKLHEPFAAMEHADGDVVRETERRPELKLLQTGQ